MIIKGKDVSNVDVSGITDMSSMFDNCDHEYEVEECGNENRTIYLNHIRKDLVHIGCFVGTREEAIKAISDKYTGAGRNAYVNKVNQLFGMVK